MFRMPTAWMGQIMACQLFSTKPLTEPSNAECQLEQLKWQSHCDEVHAFDQEIIMSVSMNCVLQQKTQNNRTL